MSRGGRPDSREHQLGASAHPAIAGLNFWRGTSQICARAVWRRHSPGAGHLPGICHPLLMVGSNHTARTTRQIVGSDVRPSQWACVHAGDLAVHLTRPPSSVTVGILDGVELDEGERRGPGSWRAGRAAGPGPGRPRRGWWCRGPVASPRGRRTRRTSWRRDAPRCGGRSVPEARDPTSPSGPCQAARQPVGSSGRARRPSWVPTNPRPSSSKTFRSWSRSVLCRAPSG
jgi:hypothetical protein